MKNLSVPIAILERALAVSRQNAGDKPYPGYQQEKAEYDRQIQEAIKVLESSFDYFEQRARERAERLDGNYAGYKG